MTDEAVSRLRRRMIEDVTIRKFAVKTQHNGLAQSRMSSPSTRRRTYFSRLLAAWRHFSPIQFLEFSLGFTPKRGRFVVKTAPHFSKFDNAASAISRVQSRVQSPGGGAM
jgi:hypothetical protein